MTGRPAVLLPVMFGAGLATGLLRFSAPYEALLLVLALALLIWRPARFLVAVAGLGYLAAILAWQREADLCTARLPPGPVRLLLRAAEPVGAEGEQIATVPYTRACGGSILARWPARNPVGAGTRAEVRGRWVARAGVGGRPGGMLIIDEARVLSVESSGAERVRNMAASASRRLYGSRAPMVDALVLGRRGGIDRELQDQFAAAGLVHLLSISGFHVGLIGGWVFLVARLARAPRNAALLLAAAVGSAYVAFLGWPPPATRAVALAWLLALCRTRQRSVQPDALLAATGLAVMLVDPWAVLDLGAWLSVGSLWGATTFGRWAARSRGIGSLARPRVIDMVASSTGATLATAPVTAAALGAVALIGVGLNLVAIPLAAVAVPGVLASLLLAPIWAAAARSLAAGAGLLLHLLELTARAGAAVPGGHVVVPAEPASALPWIGVLGIALWAMGTRNTAREAARRAALAAAVCAWLSLVWVSGPAQANGASDLTLHFLDVGQGDGAVVRTPNGHWIVIDAGPRSAHGDAGRRVVVPFLLRHGVRSLSAVVVSHAHADHIGGVEAVLDRFPTGEVLEPGEAVADPLYHEFLDAIAAAAVPWHAGRPGEHFELDGVRFTLLHPDVTWPGWGEDLNEDSLVLLVEYGTFRALFSGDIGFPVEAYLRGRIGPIDLLKVGHHGSRGSTGDAWLNELQPRAAIISVGDNNYGHPAPETLRRLAGHHVPIWRTDQQGTVAVTVHGDSMTIRGRRTAETFATSP